MNLLGRIFLNFRKERRKDTYLKLEMLRYLVICCFIVCTIVHPLIVMILLKRPHFFQKYSVLPMRSGLLLFKKVGAFTVYVD